MSLLPDDDLGEDLPDEVPLACEGAKEDPPFNGATSGVEVELPLLEVPLT